MAEITLPVVFLNVLQEMTPPIHIMTGNRDQAYSTRDVPLEECKERLGIFMQMVRVKRTEIKLAFAVVNKKQLKFREV